MARVTEPLGAVLAVSSAAHMVPPPEMPVRRPSLAARALAVAMASEAGMGTSSSIRSGMGASSSTLGMKSGVQPWIGCGLNAGCEEAGEPSALRSWLGLGLGLGLGSGSGSGLGLGLGLALVAGALVRVRSC